MNLQLDDLTGRPPAKDQAAQTIGGLVFSNDEIRAATDRDRVCNAPNTSISAATDTQNGSPRPPEHSPE